MTKKKTKKEDLKLDEQFKDETGKDSFLVLHNDEINTFEHVMESLIEVCNHDSVQAEQCTFITHHKGKCDIKKGPAKVLRHMRDGLHDRGITSTID
jgi:ATP-dependent Clp protease adaptor protein ClpS